MRHVSSMFLAAASLLAALAGGVAAQRDAVHPVTAVFDLGVYDEATGRITAAAPGDGSLGNLVYDNTDDAGVFYAPGSLFIDMDHGLLPETNGEYVVALGIQYATSVVGTVDLDVRLHEADASELKDPGAGITIPLRGLPGAIEAGQPLAYMLDVRLEQPYLLRPGGIRYSYQTFDEQTGPVLCHFNLEEWGTRNRLEVFNLNGTHLGFLKFGSGTDYASYYMQIYTQSVDFDDAGSPDSNLARRDRFRGTVEVGDSDVLLYDALAGERLKLSLATSKSTGLLPHLDVVEMASGLSVASAGDGSSNKVMLAIDELPSTGTYQVVVSGLDDTSGEYKLKVGARVPKTAIKPPSAPDPATSGALLVAFQGKVGDVLTASVKPVTAPALVDAPLLEGPVGPVDLGPYLTLKGASTYVIKKLPLPAFGAYELRAGTQVGPGTVARARVKPAKPAPNRINDFGREVAGSWLMHEFVTRASRSLLTLDLRGKKGTSTLVRNTFLNSSLYEATRTYSRWSVKAAEDLATSGGRLLTTKLSLPIVIVGDPPIPPAQESTAPFTDRFIHPDGNPNVMEFNSGIWRRDTSRGPVSPAVEGTHTSNLGSELADGQAALIIECVEGAAYFDIYRAAPGTAAAPFHPVARHVAVCAEGVTTWVDQASVGSGGFVPGTYWVRAVDAAGNQGLLSLPVTLAAP